MMRLHCVVLATLAGLSAACASPGAPPLLGPARTQPEVLVGRWRLIVPSEAVDGTLELQPTAVAVEDGVVQSDGSRTGRLRSSWWVYAADDRHPPQLCLHWRPGRHAAECRPFALDTLTTGTRRLRWGAREYVQ